MFQQFMQMGTPAAIALVGMSFAFGGVAVSLVIRGQAECSARRKYELDRITVSANSKLVEHKRRPEE